MIAHLIPLCDDGMSGITQKLALSNHSECNPEISFLLIPLSDLWETSKANGRTPNDYGLFTLCFYGEMKHYGLRCCIKLILSLTRIAPLLRNIRIFLGDWSVSSAANQGI
ncbi:hypothetical protein MTR67_025691 [Solanum verrucosum]|uniref:C-JID domain-containing protein n=1 Tax=Solanum verrucosum TaxID=315347 RepID=A0AAF0R5K7_SOLVR|nr:hypothetical protein MTR67_025691 [Solanum verrucosum]